jgi:hypothetical protein
MANEGPIRKALSHDANPSRNRLRAHHTPMDASIDAVYWLDSWPSAACIGRVEEQRWSTCTKS